MYLINLESRNYIDYSNKTTKQPREYQTETILKTRITIFVFEICQMYKKIFSLIKWRFVDVILLSNFWYEMDTSEPKWVNSNAILYGVNSLRLGGIHIH